MNLRNKTLVIGGLVGSALGILAAWLYVRTAREEETMLPRPVPPDKLIKLGLAIMAVLRQVTALSEQEKVKSKLGWLRKK